MRAAVCRAFGAPLRIEDVDLRGPGRGEATVRIAACAICHSDVAFIAGAWNGGLPAVYGHEAAGVVEEVGAGVDSVAPGDHVVVTMIRACGRCRLCLLGERALCEERDSFPLSRETPLRADGEEVVQGLRTAAFAERITVEQSQVVRIPDDVPFESASLLACGVITGVGAVRNTACMREGANAAVIGVGGVGLNAVQGAVLAGAETVLAIDLLDSKLETAKAFRATHTARVDQAADVVGELTRGRGLDYVFVAAASAKAVEQALALVGRAGTIVLIGLPEGALVQLDPELVADGSIRILGSKMGASVPQRDIPQLVSLYRDGRLKLDELISGRYPLERIEDALGAARTGEALRPVVLPT